MSNLIDEKGNEIGHPEQFDMSIYEEKIKGTEEDCEKWIEEHTKKSWLKERYPTEYEDIQTVTKHLAFRAVAKEVCKKIMEELPKYLSESLYCEVVGNLRLVFKDLGIELEK